MYPPALLHHIQGNGVQLVTGPTIGTPKVKTDAQVTSIQGALIGSKSDKNFPILVTAHYDSMSPAAVSYYFRCFMRSLVLRLLGSYKSTSISTIQPFNI